MTIGQRLKQLRKKVGWNQNQLAHQAQVPRQVIARIEAGQRDGDNMTVSVAKRLALALHVSVDHLVCVYDEGEQTAAPATQPPVPPTASRTARRATGNPGQAAPAAVKRTRVRKVASRVGY